MIKVPSKILSILILCLAPIVVSAQRSALKIPLKVMEFIEKGATAISPKTADLNGDGTKDFILVTEKSKSQPPADEADDGRSLIILTRDRTGKLNVAARNEKVVYCRSCGAFGDPFDSVEAGRKSFNVYNYGGSWQRWGDYYQFNYSRRDKTWQLVLFVETSYDSHNPDKAQGKTLTPKNFGKIDINDFDPAAMR